MGECHLRQEIRIKDLNEPISHYTDAVRFGDLLFISGVAPLDENGKVVGDENVVQQTRQVFKNMARILNVANAGFENVLRVTIYLTDVEDRVKINAVRKEFFGATRPASTRIEVSRLAVPGMKIEIEAIAGVGP
jgi:reactive intermediate/imine deaminase